ncbi:hypothetical protein TSH7_28365 [Azospirillum sp. TSH7]|nr:hypothetical protein TSH7_28365 [Azospirillum sp. TSH7]PWC61779.1 hypothetical protein TSH20_22840 [Azospirillum sp. TSH20]
MAMRDLILIRAPPRRHARRLPGRAAGTGAGIGQRVIGEPPRTLRIQDLMGLSRAMFEGKGVMLQKGTE